MSKSIYPEVSRGSLSETHEKYLHPPTPRGPKRGDTQKKIMIFGVVFFVIFLLVFAFFFGFTDYFH